MAKNAKCRVLAGLAAGVAIAKVLTPVRAYVGGAEDVPVDQSANVRAGETFVRRLMLVNDSRRTQGLSPASRTGGFRTCTARHGTIPRPTTAGRSGQIIKV